MRYIPLLLLFSGCASASSRPALEALTTSCEVAIKEAPTQADRDAIGNACLVLVDAWERSQ